MERLGTVTSETSAVAVVDAESATPEIMDRRVYNQGLDHVGKAVDLIGSVEHPYVVVEKNGRIDRGSKLYLR